MIVIPLKQNHLLDHVLYGRGRVEAREKAESLRQLASKEAVVQSRLSYNIVQFEKAIMVRAMYLCTLGCFEFYQTEGAVLQRKDYYVLSLE